MNLCFTSSSSFCKKEIAHSRVDFREVFDTPPKHIDVLVIDGGFNQGCFAGSTVNTCIYDGVNNERLSDLLSSLKNVKSVISCGMAPLDSVTFSSISYDHALLCLRRTVYFVGKTYIPCEVRVPFDTRGGIFNNLVSGLLNYCIDNF